MPLARFSIAERGEKGLIFGDGLNHLAHPYHEFAFDGVSCTLCHQVDGENFGQESSFSGHFRLDTQRPMGSRWAYGPYPTTDRYELIMGYPSGYLPQKSDHFLQAELCATCHILYTPFVNQEGEIGGTFPEQVPYLEWRQNDFVGQKVCQDCHMPPAEGGVVLSKTGGDPRSPFYQHLFVGGNAYMLRILRAFGLELGVRATSGQFEEKIHDTLQQLQMDAARLEIEEKTMEGKEVRVELNLENLSGQKFPTAFPARRAWIHLLLENGDGEVVFESGAYDDQGKLLTGNHDRDPTAYESHYDVLNSEEQVQIYETVLKDDQGKITTILLRAAGYIKDNRLFVATRV